MRPRIICHMVSSVDGRLLVHRWTKPAAGIEADILGHYDQTAARLDADGWMVGRKTMEDFAKGTAQAPTLPPVRQRTPYIGKRMGRDVAVAIDPRGKLHYGQDNAGGDHIIVVLAEDVPDEYLAELQADGVSYLFAGTAGDDLALAMETLGKTFGVHRLLLEGGGIINGAFLKAGLIDEISLLIYPGIDGLSGIPSIFEYMGEPDELTAAGQSLRHIATETLDGGMVWLRYEIEKLGA